MSNHLAGHGAEKRAALYLESKGFKILNLNWKTRFCEIDIVAQKDRVIYFVEVKYRRTSNQGMGYDYIDQKKLRQMSFAADIWVNNNSWDGEYQLSIISMDGNTINFIRDI